MMLTRFSIQFISAIGVCGVAFAEPTITETQPIAGDLFRDFKVEGCKGTFGMGYFRFNTGSSTIADRISLADICLDEENGRIYSLESYSDLTLVSKNSNGTKFEKLDGQMNDYERVILSLENSEGYSKCSTNVTNSRSVNIHIPSSRYINEDGYDQAAFYGFTADERSDHPITQFSEKVHYVLFTGISQDIDEPVDLGETKLYGIEVLGDLKFEHGAGVLTLGENIASEIGAAAGEFLIESTGDGQFVGSGEFDAESGRLAGHHPKEWISMSISQAYLRGFFIGKSGEAMAADGLGIGNFVDASGQIHNLRVIITLRSCLLE